MSRKKNSGPIIEEGDDLGEEDQREKGVSGFISKIYKMVSDPATQDIVSWNDRGDGFIVKNEFVFASQIMRSYFRHQNFSSFVRQLNFYGFHKRSSPSSLTSFYHPSFKKGHPELLNQIIRKSTESSQKDAGLRDMVTNLQSEVAELRQQNEDLFKIQQRILYIFSRYMRATQGGQQSVTGGTQAALAAGSGSSGNESAGSKRLRGGGAGGSGRGDSGADSKRARLLLDSKPNSPPTGHEYHADNYASSPDVDSGRDSRGKSNADYFMSTTSTTNAAAAAHSPPELVVDLNTDLYSQTSHGGSHGNAGYGSSHEAQPLYGSHSLSDLNWASDPVSAINDLIHKMPPGAQSVLNSSTSLPMQMGRAGVNGALQAAASGQPYLVDSNSFNFAGQEMYNGGSNNTSLVGRGGRGGPSQVSVRGGNANQQLLDLTSQLATSNPKQLLQMLDRIGADTGMDEPGSAAGPRGGARAGGASAAPLKHETYGNANISGVFEDAEPEPMLRSAGTRGSRSKRVSGGAASKQPSSSPLSPQGNTATGTRRSARAAAAAATSGEEGYSGARLSPVDDAPVVPGAPFASLKTETTPMLNSLPLPTSPISPFIHDASLDAFPAGAAAPGVAPTPTHAAVAHTPATSSLPLPSAADAHYALLHSPSLPLPDLSRGLSGGSALTSGDHGIHAGPTSTGFFPPSPYQGALPMPPVVHSLEPLIPLTPHSELLNSTPPSPNPNALPFR